MEYVIRFATKKDTDSIMSFIDKYWRKDHILSRDRQLFEWQYGSSTDRLNIVIGIDDTGALQGMLGFVPYDDTDSKDIALALWKANPSTGFLGIKLAKYLMDNEPHREVVCPGINLETTSKIYEYLGMHVGTMTQWYRLAMRDTYMVAKVIDDTIPPYYRSDKHIIAKKIDDIKELQMWLELSNNEAYQNAIPFKSISYLQKRYFEHHSYQYLPYAFKFDEDVDDFGIVIVFRIQECNGSKALRMIDCIGNIEKLKYITPCIDDLLVSMDCEYVDFYEAGVDNKIMEDSGFRKVEEMGNIIPNYFAPFEQRKVDIHFSTSQLSAILFKGDGDQDRPN